MRHPTPLLAAQLKSAAGAYDEMPPIALLCNYLPDAERRAFVDKMYEVKVKSEEVIMRQGARAAMRLAARAWRSHDTGADAAGSCAARR